MFFYVSKVFWVLVQPVSLTFLLCLLGWVLVALGRKRLGLTAGALGLLVLGVTAFTTAGVVLIMPLEARFVRPAVLPHDVSTIIMLGGATSGRVSSRRQIAELTEAADRLTETLRLARMYPQARIVLSGGSGLMVEDGESEASTAQRFFVGLGIDPTRLVLEGDSRNTDENAANTLAVLGEVTGSVVLVTSAFHMPRSVGIFRRAGLDAVAWPTDYRSTGAETFGVDVVNPMANLMTTSVAIKEWIGLLVYSLTGRSSELFPAQTSN